MSEEQNSPSSEDAKIREHLVNTAVNFLLNPGVISKPHEHKTAFLRKKGLTEAEISLAFKKAESDPKFNSIQTNEYTSSVLPPPVPVYSKQISFWSQLSALSSSLILLGVAIYGAHYFYKKFIEPLIFGEVSRNDSSSKLEQQYTEVKNLLSQLDKTVLALHESIGARRIEQDKYMHDSYQVALAVKELKSELGSIKSMLLNRNQFPALPKTTPTIPPWQLPSHSSENVTEQDGSVEKQDPEKSNNMPSTEHTKHSNSENSITTNGDIVETFETHCDKEETKLNTTVEAI